MGALNRADPESMRALGTSLGVSVARIEHLAVAIATTLGREGRSTGSQDPMAVLTTASTALRGSGADVIRRAGELTAMRWTADTGAGVAWTFIGGVGTGADLAASAAIVAGVTARTAGRTVGSVVTWDAPASHGVLQLPTGVVTSAANLVACDLGRSCAVAGASGEVAAGIAAHVSRSHRSAEVKIVAHSLGVTVLSHAVAHDSSVLADVDEVVLVAGPAVESAAFDSFVEDGGDVTVMYDPTDPVAVGGRFFDWDRSGALDRIVARRLDSPLAIEGAELVPVRGAGHSGFFASSHGATLTRALLD